jgi:hypothetical protein
MNIYSEKLNIGALEVLEYYEQNKSRLGTERPWKNVAEQMQNASSLSVTALAEGAIRAIARLIVDEFPLDEAFCPSFNAALGAVHKAEKARRRRG